jgi:ring-1,2-phenylacetyl-CoA epoxidase subunit PaaD
MIDEQIVQAIGAIQGIQRVEVEHVFDPPWQAHRITPAGRERLRAHGVTVPGGKFVQLNLARDEAVACPFCNSQDTRLDSPFGPTRCRMIYYCQACRNSFEHIKAV